MIKCIIIEDQHPAQRILKKYVEDIGSLELVGMYSDAIAAMETLDSEPIDLMFLDIHLPKLSGLDFLKALDNPPAVILTTAFQEFALEGYELNVVDYLLKPFSFQRFVKAVAKVKGQQVSVGGEPHTEKVKEVKEIFLKSGYEHIRVIFRDIVYLKTDGDYVEVHVGLKKHLSSEPLVHWEERLGGVGFVRIHRSYIINMNAVKKVSGNRVILRDDTEIPIGRTYKLDFMNRYLL